MTYVIQKRIYVTVIVIVVIFTEQSECDTIRPYQRGNTVQRAELGYKR